MHLAIVCGMASANTFHVGNLEMRIHQCRPIDSDCKVNPSLRHHT